MKDYPRKKRREQYIDDEGKEKTRIRELYELKLKDRIIRSPDPLVLHRRDPEAEE